MKTVYIPTKAYGRNSKNNSKSAVIALVIFTIFFLFVFFMMLSSLIKFNQTAQRMAEINSSSSEFWLYNVNDSGVQFYHKIDFDSDIGYAPVFPIFIFIFIFFAGFIVAAFFAIARENGLGAYNKTINHNVKTSGRVVSYLSYLSKRNHLTHKVIIEFTNENGVLTKCMNIFTDPMDINLSNRKLFEQNQTLAIYIYKDYCVLDLQDALIKSGNLNESNVKGEYVNPFINNSSYKCECGEHVKDGLLYCPRCGRPVNKNNYSNNTNNNSVYSNQTEVKKEKFCIYCGAKVPEDSNFCPKCGAKIQ